MKLMGTLSMIALRVLQKDTMHVLDFTDLVPKLEVTVRHSLIVVVVTDSRPARSSSAWPPQQPTTTMCAEYAVLHGRVRSAAARLKRLMANAGIADGSGMSDDSALIMGLRADLMAMWNSAQYDSSLLEAGVMSVLRSDAVLDDQALLFGLVEIALLRSADVSSLTPLLHLVWRRLDGREFAVTTFGALLSSLIVPKGISIDLDLQAVVRTIESSSILPVLARLSSSDRVHSGRYVRFCCDDDLVEGADGGNAADSPAHVQQRTRTIRRRLEDRGELCIAIVGELMQLIRGSIAGFPPAFAIVLSILRRNLRARLERHELELRAIFVEVVLVSALLRPSAFDICHEYYIDENARINLRQLVRVLQALGRGEHVTGCSAHVINAFIDANGTVLDALIRDIIPQDDGDAMLATALAANLPPHHVAICQRDLDAFRRALVHLSAMQSLGPRLLSLVNALERATPPKPSATETPADGDDADSNGGSGGRNGGSRCSSSEASPHRCARIIDTSGDPPSSNSSRAPSLHEKWRPEVFSFDEGVNVVRRVSLLPLLPSDISDLGTLPGTVINDALPMRLLFHCLGSLPVCKTVRHGESFTGYLQRVAAYAEIHSRATQGSIVAISPILLQLTGFIRRALSSDLESVWVAQLNAFLDFSIARQEAALLSRVEYCESREASAASMDRLMHDLDEAKKRASDERRIGEFISRGVLNFKILVKGTPPVQGRRNSIRFSILAAAAKKKTVAFEVPCNCIDQIICELERLDPIRVTEMLPAILDAIMKRLGQSLKESIPGVHYATRAVRRYIITRMFPTLFRLSATCRSENVGLQSQLTQYADVTLANLDLVSSPALVSALAVPIGELMRLNTFLCPRQKVDCIVACTRLTMDALRVGSASTSVPGSDDLLPALVFVILRAAPAQLNRNCAFCRLFWSGSDDQGDVRDDQESLNQFCLVQFLSACKFIAEMDAGCLTSSPPPADVHRTTSPSLVAG